MRFTTDQHSFLARFSKSPDGQQVVDILNAKLAEVGKGLRTATGEEIYRQQGRALELDELLADFKEASAKLTRLQPAPKAPRFEL